MIDLHLSDNQRALYDGTRARAARELKPIADAPRIYEAASEIQREIIARRLFREAAA